jgi:hypothetical protein
LCRLDPNYATGTVAAPVPNGQLDKQTFRVESSTGPNAGQTKPLTVKDWIASIQAGTLPDTLTTLDTTIDSSIRHLGDALENVLGITRGVPLFEFRGLVAVTASGFQDFATRVENAVIAYHKASPNAARLIKRNPGGKYSHIQRQASITACPSATYASTSAPGPSVTYACYNYAAPDQGVADFCTCSNGASMPVANATGTNTRSAYILCPYTTPPPLPSSKMPELEHRRLRRLPGNNVRRQCNNTQCTALQAIRQRHNGPEPSTRKYPHWGRLVHCIQRTGNTLPFASLRINNDGSIWHGHDWRDHLG